MQHHSEPFYTAVWFQLFGFEEEPHTDVMDQGAQTFGHKVFFNHQHKLQTQKRLKVVK